MYRNIALGINYYLEGNYRQSIDQFSSISSNTDLQSDLHFYSALSYLGLGEYRTAQDILQSSLEGASKYQAETLWYLSLCYIKSGEFDQAREALSQLEIYDGLYKKDTQALLKKLRRFTP
jgi:tetratricopeptide (TPR) repeat protein